GSRPGAAGAVAMDGLVASEPDGHTLPLVAAPSTVVTPMIQDAPYDADSFVPIGVITEVPSVLAVAGESGFADGAAFFAAARERPGELTVGTPGATTSQAIELRRLAETYGVQVTVVPFNGNAELTQAVLGGTVDAVLINVSHDVRAPFDAGAFRPLAVSTAERLDYLPDVPTLAELGFPELTYSTSLFGLGAPAGTPQEVVAKLEAAMREGLADPGIRAQLDAAYVPDEFIGAAALRERRGAGVRAYRPVPQHRTDGARTPVDTGLQGRTAVVPGASSGLGLAVARSLAAEGANVVLGGRRGELVREEAAKLPLAVGVEVDITDPAAADALVGAAIERFGPVDVLVLNGGGPPPGTAVDFTPEQLTDAVNLLVAPHQRLVRAVLPGMRERGFGRIVAIGSSGVQSPIERLVASNAGRAALAGYLKTLASEVAADGVTVNM